MTIAVDLGRKATKQTNKQIVFVLANGADPGEAPALHAYILWSIWLSKYSTTKISLFHSPKGYEANEETCIT